LRERERGRRRERESEGGETEKYIKEVILENFSRTQ
jgi:hypothetical protein